MLSTPLVVPLNGAGRRLAACAAGSGARRVSRASALRPLATPSSSLARHAHSDTASAPEANEQLVRRVEHIPKKRGGRRFQPDTRQYVRMDTAGETPQTSDPGSRTTTTLVGAAQIGSVFPYRPNLWLRDMCQCEKCVDPHSGQKSFATSELDFVPTAKSVERHDDGSTTVVWAEDPVSGGQDHTSHYPKDLIESWNKFPRRQLWNRETFEQGRDKCRVSYDDWMAGGSEFWAAMAQLSRTGLIFVYDVPQGDEQAVERIGEQIGGLQETFYGRTWDVISKPQAENVAYTAQFLGLHQDLLYYPDPPRVQLLHCLANECEGGESLFSDGVHAAQLISNVRNATIQTLVTQPTAYHYNKNGNVYYAERPVVRSRPGRAKAVIENVWWSPPFQAPFPFSTRTDLAAWHLAAKQFQAEIERPEHVVEYRLRPGECVVFDNWRVLHGRRRFNSSTGRRHLKGTYVDDRTYRAKLDDMPLTLAEEHQLWTAPGIERLDNKQLDQEDVRRYRTDRKLLKATTMLNLEVRDELLASHMQGYLKVLQGRSHPHRRTRQTSEEEPPKETP